MDIEKVLEISGRIRTPLGLAGIIIVVLYMIYEQVLSLGVFESIGPSSTFILLQYIIDKLFLLALVAIILSIGSYFVLPILNRNHSRSSNIKLIDASLDKNDSQYEETVEKRKKYIRPIRKKNDND